MKDSTDNPEVIIQKKKWTKPDFYILDEATIESGSNVSLLEVSSGILVS